MTTKGVGSAPIHAWRSVAFLASAGAAGIHFGATRPHLREYAPAGVFMLVAGVAQLGWAIWISRPASRRVMEAGLLGNAATVAVWVFSRTAGMPWALHPWMPEHIHLTDALATVLELLVIAAVFALLSERDEPPSGSLVRATWVAAATSLIVASHDPAHEQLAALATLAVAFVLRSFIASVKSVSVGPARRSHVQNSYRGRVVARRVATARAGAGAS